MEIVEPHNCWNEQDVAVITYGDSLVKQGERPLQTLRRFLSEHMGNMANTVHILPFCPYSSDDGFSIIDYQAVNPDLGNWGDIESISKQFRIMADLVINHCSVKSEWFENFIKGEGNGHDYFSPWILKPISVRSFGPAVRISYPGGNRKRSQARVVHL